MENKPMISETEKREALKHFMAEKAKAPVCVAFSGGVDSSLILKLACDTAKKTGMPVYAVTFHTMLHPACDLEIAERVATSAPTGPPSSLPAMPTVAAEKRTSVGAFKA